MAPLPWLKGPKPLAFVLVRFNDVPIPDTPISRFRDFVTSSGKGGLYDYIREVSNHNITLDGSEVFGWFDMKYSYVKDGWNPFHVPDITKGEAWRNAWIYEAHRLCKENGIDLSKFAGVVACTNANGDGGAGAMNSFAMGVGGNWGQTKWYKCTKCKGIAFSGNPTKGKCWDGTEHNLGVGEKFALSINEPTFIGQENWRWCKKCESIYWAGQGSTPNNWGSCFAGAVHDGSGSGNYRMKSQVWSGVPISGWKHCYKCHQLALASEQASSHCAGGGQHDHTDSWEYTLAQYFDELSSYGQPHETLHILGFDHSYARPEVEYGDPYDMMSAFRIKNFDNKNFAPAGCGLNAPNLYKQGWVPDSRIYRLKGDQNRRSSAKLIALSRATEEPGLLMVRWETRDRVYFVEFREKDGWDRGIDRPCVLIHELRSKYVVGQNRFRWCRKCHSLHYVPEASCAAGDLHALDYSKVYRVEFRDFSGSLQTDWTPCAKCHCVYHKGFAGSCPGTPGQGHSPYVGRTSTLALRLNDSGAIGQKNWKWCRKCSVIVNKDNSGTFTCPQGGTHNFLGSGEYTINNTADGPGLKDFTNCTKCNSLVEFTFGFCPANYSHDFSGSFDYSLAKNDANAPGTAGFKICKGCSSLVNSSVPGLCGNARPHDLSLPDSFTVDSTPTVNGQKGWKVCTRCQILFYSVWEDSSRCFAGGKHAAGGVEYKIANHQDDRTYLVWPELLPGETQNTFEDAERGVRVVVGAALPNEHAVMVALGPRFPVINPPVGGVLDGVAPADEEQVNGTDPEVSNT